MLLNILIRKCKSNKKNIILLIKNTNESCFYGIFFGVLLRWKHQ